MERREPSVASDGDRVPRPPWLPPAAPAAPPAPRPRSRGQRGFTLIELLVVITVIAILTAVVTVAVGGFINQANEKTRAAQFGALQTAIETYVSNHLNPSGDLALATYPFIKANGGTGAARAFVELDATAPSTGSFSETYAAGWYGPDGKPLSPQPSTATGKNAFVYADLYSSGDTNLAKAGFISAGTVKSPGTPGTAGAVLRCLFVSSVGPAAETDGAASEAAAKTAKIDHP